VRLPQPDLYDLEGWLSRSEGDRLAFLASQVPADQCIVELGSYRGKSSCFLARGALAGNRPLVHCVDLWSLGGQWETDVARRAGPPLHQDHPEHYEAFKSTLRRFGLTDVIIEVHGNTTEVGASWGGPPVGLLFVDADHRCESTKADLDAWTPHMAPGGWVVCHDYWNDDYPGVMQAVDEWKHDRLLAETGGTSSMIELRLCAT
jgi:predicted O-methyltransferase YrrM